MVEELFKSIGEHVLTPIIIGVGIGVSIWFKSWWDSRHFLPSLKISAEKNEKIQDLLIEIRIRLQADRAYLGMFHNGNKYSEGSEIIKMSRTNESAAPGISLEAQHYQNILISLIVDETRLIDEEGPSFTNVMDLPDGKFKRMCETRGIVSVARCAIRKDKDIIGFVGLDYSRLIEKPQNIEDLCKYAGILEQVLTDYRSK
jgi:hypothetical protein